MRDPAGRPAVDIEHQDGVALVPSGGLAQDNAGEMFSPTQFGLDLLLPANFVASRSPSLKPVEDSVNTPCAWAPCTQPKAKSASAPERIEARICMTSPL
jgi:hypothetical protein